MYCTNLSSKAATVLFTALQKSTLKVLAVSNNNITDDASEAITKTLKENTSLIILRINDNPISGKVAQCMLESLQHNDVLRELSLPNYPQDIKKMIVALQNVVNEKRHSRYCSTELDVKFEDFVLYGF